MLPLWVRVDLGVMAMKGELQIPQISEAGVSPLDGVFYTPTDCAVKKTAWMKKDWY